MQSKCLSTSILPRANHFCQAGNTPNWGLALRPTTVQSKSIRSSKRSRADSLYNGHLTARSHAACSVWLNQTAWAGMPFWHSINWSGASWKLVSALKKGLSMSLAKWRLIMLKGDCCWVLEDFQNCYSYNLKKLLPIPVCCCRMHLRNMTKQKRNKSIQKRTTATTRCSWQHGSKYATNEPIQYPSNLLLRGFSQSKVTWVVEAWSTYQISACVFTSLGGEVFLAGNLAPKLFDCTSCKRPGEIADRLKPLKHI